jgi:hypothetical protein
LALTTWFLAIRSFAGNTSMTARELMTITGISRPATARAMLRRIRRAVEEGNVHRGLAGLAVHPLTTHTSERLTDGITKREIMAGPKRRKRKHRSRREFRQ